MSIFERVVTNVVSGAEDSSKIVNLGAEPQVAAWSSSGLSLVVGDAKGRLHFISAAGVLMFSQQVFDPAKVAAAPTGMSSLLHCRWLSETFF